MGQSAFGTLFQVGSGSPEVFVSVAEVQKIGEISLESDEIDLTHHESAEAFEEVVMGIIKTGVVPLTFNFIPSNVTHDESGAGLLNLLKTQEQTNFQMVFPDTAATTFSFAGFVKKVSVDAPHDGKIAGTADIKITGPVTLA